MNDAFLSAELQTLRAAPPAGNFEAQLQQALLAEATRMQAGASPGRARARAARRWGGRIGVGVALAFVASAAAAAAGYLAMGPSKHGSHIAPELDRIDASSERNTRPAPRRGEPATPTVSRELELTPAPAMAAPVPTLAFEPAAPEVRPASPRRGAALLVRRTQPSPVPRPEPHVAPALTAAADDERDRVQLLDLPKATPIPVGAPGARDSKAGRAKLEHLQRRREATAASKPRRHLPLPHSRAEQGRPRADTSERQRGADAPGRAVSRERSARHGAERGLERARQVHERNGN
jgi:hypothetical protein